LNNQFIALIGAGYWGKNLLRNFEALNVLVGCYDSDEEVRKNISINYPSVKIYRTLKELLSDKSVTAVCIATPAITHGDIVSMSLNSGKHVFVEKPLCLDIKQGEKLVALSKKLKLKLMVGHLLLYHPAFIALKKIVYDGKLGKLRYLYSTRLALGKFRREENALWSFAPHDISMILSLVKKDPLEVGAFGGNYLYKEVADTTVTFLKFPLDIRAHIFVSWLHPYKDQRLVVVGEKSMAVFEDVAVGSKKLMLYKHKASWDGEQPILEKADGEPISYDHYSEPLRAECEAFIDLVKFNKVVPSDGDEGLKILRILNKADNSLKNKDKDEK